MKKSKYASLVLTCAISAAMLITGCGASSNSAGSYREAAQADYASDYDYGLYDMAAEEAAYESPSAEYKSESGSSNTQVEEMQDQNRKLITTVNLTAETEDLPETIVSVEGKVKELGGYIESSNIYNGSSSKYSTREASLTVRIPSKRLDDFVDSIEGNTNITRKTVNVEDVTLRYVDTESRKNSLKTEEKRLLDIMESASSVEDLITIEDKLADVRYELESIESQLRSYDNQVDYSTIYLSITEVVKYTPVEEEGAFKRMGEGFMESVKSVVEGFVELCIAFVTAIPHLVVLILFILLCVFIGKKCVAASKKNKAKKMAMQQSAMAANYQASQMRAMQQPVQGQQGPSAAKEAKASEPDKKETKDDKSKGDNGDKQ